MKTISAESNRFYVSEVDITRDFAGSFKLNEVVEHFENNYGLTRGYERNCYFMEKDMKQRTGPNCFVMKKENLRFKLYLKFPQMICKDKVRENLGFNLRNWVSPGKHYSRLNSTLKSKLAQERGLSRIEVSIKNPPLDVDELKRVHMDFTDMLIPSLVRNTSHASMWTAFADNLKHTLIVVDEDISLPKNEKGLAVVVYAYDKLTNDLCGFEVRDWQSKCTQVMSRFTLSSLLPIDLIKVSKLHTGTRTLNLQIEGARYQKIMKVGRDDITFLTNSRGQFCFGNTELEDYGLIKHRHINLVLPTKSYNRCSVVPAHIVLNGEIDVKIVDEVNRFLSAERVKEQPLLFHVPRWFESSCFEKTKVAL